HPVVAAEIGRAGPRSPGAGTVAVGAQASVPTGDPDVDVVAHVADERAAAVIGAHALHQVEDDDAGVDGRVEVQSDLVARIARRIGERTVVDLHAVGAAGPQIDGRVDGHLVAGGAD